MMGGLFDRGVSPTEIEEMTFTRMKYWNNWHEIFRKAEIKAAQRVRGQRNKGK